MLASKIQQSMRLFHWTEYDVYRFFNVNHPGYPDNLPPPPNFRKLQQFYFACLDQTIKQMNEENSPSKGPPQQAMRRPMRR